MAVKKTLYREVIKSFFLAIKRLSLYAVNHPLSREMLSKLFKIFDVLLKEEKEILLCVGSNVNEILINGQLLDKDILGVPEIYDNFISFKLDGVVFMLGLTSNELAHFVKAFASPSILDGGKAAPVPELLQKGSRHIRIRNLRYEKIDQNQKVVSSDVPDAARRDKVYSLDAGEEIGIDALSALVLQDAETPGAKKQREAQERLSRGQEVLVSKKKLQRLLEISERFEDEVGLRVKEATKELTLLNRRLADEKERSDGIIRHLADGLVVVDKFGRVVMMNPAAEKLLGKEKKSAIGKSLIKGLKEEHVLAVAKGPLDDKDPSHITKEIELAGKNEETKRVLRASSAVVENEDGNTVGMVSVLSDITHEKEFNDLKSHFVSMVTHELRTPIVAIQKSLELVLSKVTGELSPDQEKFLSISKFNLDRLNRLINELLDMSKLEAGKLKLNPSEFDFNEIIAETKSSLQSWAEDKEITLHLDSQEMPIMIFADRDRIVQVLVNLIGNALKFTPTKGKISIFAKSLNSKEGICPEPCLEVCVFDTGIGIDPKDFTRIFNKFEQVSLVSPAGRGGSGLGLPITKEIISLHAGRIWVESEKNKGSRFIFVIPLKLKFCEKEE